MTLSSKIKILSTFLTAELLVIYFMFTSDWSVAVLLAGALFEVLIVFILFINKTRLKVRNLSKSDVKVLQNLSYIPESNDTLSALSYAEKTDVTYGVLMPHKQTLFLQVVVIVAAITVIYFLSAHMGQQLVIIDLLLFSMLLLLSHVSIFLLQYVNTNGFVHVRFENLQKELAPVTAYAAFSTMAVLLVTDIVPDSDPFLYLYIVIGVKIVVDLISFNRQYNEIRDYENVRSKIAHE